MEILFKYLLFNHYVLACSDYRITFSVNVNGANHIECINMRNYEVIYFAGLTTPPTHKFSNPNENKLYKPLASNYPGYDFFYYDAEKRTFYLIQITTKDDPIDHVIEIDNLVYTYKENGHRELKSNSYLSKEIEAWLNYFNMVDSSESRIKFNEIWMIDKNRFHQSHMANENDRVEPMRQKQLEDEEKKRKNRDRKLERSNRMNIIYFQEMDSLPIVSNYFKTKNKITRLI